MIMKIIKALWIGAAVFVLFVTLYGYDGKPYSDIWILSTWLMLTLSFPALTSITPAGNSLRHNPSDLPVH